MTLKATWRVAKNLTVTFNANGGVVENTSKSVKEATKYGDLPTPTKVGYKFVGWYTKASGGSKVTSTTTVTATSNHTLYAYWTAKTYKYIVKEIDLISPQYDVIFYEEGVAISVLEVYNSSGKRIVAAINGTVVSMDKVKITNPLKIKLSSGAIVTAVKK